MPRHGISLAPQGLAEHPAVKAWAELQAGHVEPCGVDLLKGRKATARRSTYRLVGAGPGHSAVIAKRCRHAKAMLERAVYEQILSRLPVPAMRYYGCVEELDGASSWLFLEDVGRERYSTSLEAHRRIAGEWLGLLHTRGAHGVPVDRLPDFGPDHYLQRLHSGQERITAALENRALTEDDRGILHQILAKYHLLEAHWVRVERFCQRLPRSVVHGDFVAKNIAVRSDGSGITLLPFDWGEAGWGFPAIDLAQCTTPCPGFAANADLAAYWAVARDHWRGVGFDEIVTWATLGTLYRTVLAVNWDALSLTYKWTEEPVGWMALYGAMLDQVLASHALD